MIKTHYVKATLVLFFMLFLSAYSGAQDLEDLKDKKPFAISGGIGLGTTFFHSNQDFKVRDPFAWSLNANLTPSIYGFTLPFSVIVTQYSQSYRTPFTQIGISPTYKWATLHLGYRHISLSPLVFQGSSFLGVGVELKPKKFQFSGFYGRLNKAITYDISLDHSAPPQYSRLGYGFKVGVGGTKHNFSLQFFNAKDDINSIDLQFDPLDPLSNLPPQENSVLGTSWRFTFFKRLTFTGDLAASLLNQDMRFEYITEVGDIKLPSFIQSIVPLNYSSTLSYSGQTMLGLSLKSFNIYAGYKRVAPDFISLGVPYAVNDIQMFTGNVSTNLFKNKISINASGNHQENNLEKNRASTIQSSTGNMNINAFINQHWNLNLNATGVYIFQKDGTMQLDESSRMNQLMTSYSLSPTYSTNNDRFQNTIGVNLAYTDLDDRNTSTQEYTNGSSVNTSLNYNILSHKTNIGGLFMVNYNQYLQSHLTYESVGFNVGGNTQLLKDKNLSLNGSVGYYINKSSSAEIANNTTFSLSANYRVKKHSFSFYTNYIITPPVNLNPLDEVYRVPYAVNSKNFSGGLNYSYSF